MEKFVGYNRKYTASGVVFWVVEQKKCIFFEKLRKNFWF